VLTPAQTRDLVEHFGSQLAASKAIGVSHPTIAYWLDPEPKRARSRREYDALTGLGYNRKLLLNRRTKALIRRRKRSTQTRGT